MVAIFYDSGNLLFFQKSFNVASRYSKDFEGNCLRNSKLISIGPTAVLRDFWMASFCSDNENSSF